MYPLVRGRWSFPGTVTCIITWVAQGILSVIINYDLIWPWCPKRAVERFIQWFVQHCVAHDRHVKSPRACIRLKVSPGACVRLVVLWIVGFTIVFTRWRNLLKLYTKKSWVWPMQDKLSAEGSFVYSWVLFIHTCNLTITGKLRHVVTFIHPLVTDVSHNLGKQFYQGQNLGSEWSVVSDSLDLCTCNKLVAFSTNWQVNFLDNRQVHQGPTKNTRARTGHWASWPAERMALPAWFDHLVKRFSYKEVRFEQNVLPACENWLPFCWKHSWNPWKHSTNGCYRLPPTMPTLTTKVLHLFHVQILK